MNFDKTTTIVDDSLIITDVFVLHLLEYLRHIS